MYFLLNGSKGKPRYEYWKALSDPFPNWSDDQLEEEQ